MKETSATIEIRGPGQVRGRQRAGVRAFHHDDAIVVAQLPVQLPVGDVEGHHGLSAALEEAVRETARRCPHVEAAPAGRVEAEPREGVRELDPPAGHVARALVDGDLGVIGHELTGLLGARTVAAEAHLAREHGSSGAGSRLEQAALGQERVEPALGHAWRVPVDARSADWGRLGV